MSQNENTKVKFDLWTVLGFLVLLVALCLAYLFTAQGTIQDKAQVVSERVTKLEANYGHIIDGIGELKMAQSKVVDALNAHEKSTAALMKSKRMDGGN